MHTENPAALALYAQVQRHPYRSVLFAAGLGYVLGGGLFTRFTFTALRVGLRMGALPFLRRELVDVADTLLGARSNTPS